MSDIGVQFLFLKVSGLERIHDVHLDCDFVGTLKELTYLHECTLWI